MSETRREAKTRKGAPSQVRRVVLWSLLGVGVLIVALGAWLGIRGSLAYGHLQKAASIASSIKADSLTHPADIADVLTQLQAETRPATDLTSDVVWQAASALPWVGPNLHAVAEAAGVLDDVASGALPPLVDAMGTVTPESLIPQGGSVDVASLRQIQPTAALTADRAAKAESRAAAIDTTNVLEPVRTAVIQLQDKTVALAEGTSVVKTAATLLPAMLGVDQPRNYLLLFLNNAELRSAGGIVGSLALVHTENGHISLTGQAASTDFPEFKEGILSLPITTQGIYGRLPAQYIQNVSMVPQFELTGQLAQAMWQKKFGGTVDGVVSVDPVALSYILRATGPVDLVGGEQLTSSNAVHLLLNEIYLREPKPALQDAFFALAAQRVFARLTAGHLDTSALLDALTQAGDEHRINIWSARTDEQALLAGSDLSGGLPTSDERTTRFGIYLNDGTGAKMSYYLSDSVTTAAGGCVAGGATEFTVTFTLTSNAPANAATLPDYVTGAAVFGIPRGTVRTLVNIYAPPAMLYAGGTIDGVESNKITLSTDTDRLIAQTTIDLTPGQTTAVAVKFSSTAPMADTPETRVTPTVNSDVTNTVTTSCENALD